MGADDYGTAFVCGLLLLIPAIVVFTTLNILRIRRSRFNRQRINRPSSKS
jgi:hypothetical protein